MWITKGRRLHRLLVPVIQEVWPFARLWYRLWGLRLDGDPTDSVWYFAYGANMHDSVFRERRKMHPVEWRVGRIKDYCLRFNLEGRPKGKAAPANISPDGNAEVWGVLYRITRRDLIRLNASEGIPGWRYRLLWLDAEDRDEQVLRIVTYVADGKLVQTSMHLDASQPCRSACIWTSRPNHQYRSRRPPRSSEGREYRSGKETDRDRRRKILADHESWSRSWKRHDHPVAGNSAGRRRASSRRSTELNKALDDALCQVQTFDYSACRQTTVVLPKQKGKEGA
ncbi:MAG: gamma-glutamylcyclotransferase family protein [Geminicoccaceae bacterium]